MFVLLGACRCYARLRVAVVGGGARVVHTRASEVGGAAAREGTRAGACERVLFVTFCHCNKYAFIKVFACGDLCLGVRVSSALPILRFSDREEPQGPHNCALTQSV